jgi:putative ABC transport system permease protein
MLRHLPLVLKNAARNRRRTLLATLSIAASFCLLGVLLALYYAFFMAEATPEQARRLVVRHRVSLVNALPISHLNRIRSTPGVADAMVFEYFGGIYKDERDLRNYFGRFAADVDRLFRIYPDYRVSDADREAFLHDRTGCIVGRPLAERFNFQRGDRITLRGDIFPVTLELTVRGIYDKPRDNENLFFHYEYLRESVPAGERDLVYSFGVLAESVDAAPRIAEAIDAQFENSADATKTETERAFELSFLSFLGNVKLFLLALSGALTFTLMLVSANTVAMSVRERIHEVGVLKTLGYTRGMILAILLGEAAAISAAGGALGMALAEAICALLRTAPILFVDLKAVHVPAAGAAVSLAAAALIGAFGGLAPALGASRRSIIDALRGQD